MHKNSAARSHLQSKFAEFVADGMRRQIVSENCALDIPVAQGC
jgi:hypothetical protein